VRIDLALAELIGCTRSHAQKLLEEQRVFCNGDVITKPKNKVLENDSLELKNRTEPQTQLHFSLDIVYEDEFLLVINKPAGLVVHPAAGHEADTLVNALLAHSPSLSDFGDFPGIVHRLDKDTSGLILVAKTNAAHQALAKQFAPVCNEQGAEKKAQRTYVAFVYGIPPASSGTIKTHIARHRMDRTRMCVVLNRDDSRKPHGRLAITKYKLMQTWCVSGNGEQNKFIHIHSEIGLNIQKNDVVYNNAMLDISFMKFNLLTGRTHQIRVHCLHAGFPILGDPVYGRKHAPSGPDDISNFSRQALHAERITFEHPETRNTMDFEAPLPDDMHRVLNVLRTTGKGGHLAT
jgi:23S rRNA pseudouridine1911/1915/1917 synthase